MLGKSTRLLFRIVSAERRPPGALPCWSPGLDAINALVWLHRAGRYDRRQTSLAISRATEKRIWAGNR
jgi:hypothetical protein